MFIKSMSAMKKNNLVFRCYSNDILYIILLFLYFLLVFYLYLYFLFKLKQTTWVDVHKNYK